MASMEEENFLALERVYLRLGHSGNAGQLTSFCEKYIPFLLERLETSVESKPPDTSSRDKILDILTQLKKRLRSNTEAGLPVAYLLEAYKKDSSALIRNFSFLFLKLGFVRLPIEDQVKFASELMEASVKKSYEQQLGIWFHLLPLIRAHFGLNNKNQFNEANKYVPMVDLNAFPKPFVSKFLDFCADVLLLPEGFDLPPRPPSLLSVLFGGGGGQDPDDVGQQGNQSGGGQGGGPGGGGAPPSPGGAGGGVDDRGFPLPPQGGPRQPTVSVPRGVSTAFFNMLTEEIKTPLLAHLSSGYQSQTSATGSTPLVETKVGIIRMLSTCQLPSEEVSWLWAFGSADAHHSVVHAADMQMKQAVGAGLNHVVSFRKLYDRYLGNSKQQQIPEAERRQPIELKAKLKIMSYFIRYADTSASIFPQSVQAVFENWFGRGTNEKLRLLGTEMALRVVENLKGQMAAVFSPILFANVRKLLDQTHDPKLGVACYAVMGRLGNKHTAHVLVGKKRIESIQELFDDLSTIGNEDICAAAHTCLLEWLDGFANDDESTAKQIDGTLLEACILAYAEHTSAKCRLIAVRFLEKLFPSDHAPSRYALFMASVDKDEKVRREALGILRKAELEAEYTKTESGAFERATRYFYEKIQRLFEMQQDATSRISAETLQKIISYLHGLLLLERRKHHEGSEMFVDEERSMTMIFPDDDDDVLELDAYFTDESKRQQWRPFLELIALYLDKFGVVHQDVLDYLAELLFLCEQETVRSVVLPILTPVIPKLIEASEVQARTATSEGLIKKLAEILSYIYALTKSPAEIERELESGLNQLKTGEFLSAFKIYLHTLLYERMNEEDESNSGTTWMAYSKALCDRFRRAAKNWEMANLDILVNGLKTLALHEGLKECLTDEEKRDVVQLAVEVIKSRKEVVGNRHKERCVEFVGCWITGEPELALWEVVVKDLMASAEGPPTIGLQPSIGNTLVAFCIAPLECSPYCDTKGSYSYSLNDLKHRLEAQLRVKNAKSEETGRRIKWLLNRLLIGEEAEKISKNKNHKQACSVWMEVFLQICGHIECAQGFFEKLQSFFISCLAEQNDFTQDVASRCLSLLYHCTQSVEQRSVLARSMREQLTATTAKESLLPYQEMCALCAGTCQRPEMVYDMVLLALNRRSESKATAGGRKKPDRNAVFVSFSAEKLRPFERVLVPAVYRLLYDPNPHVKRISHNLWASMNDHHKKVGEEKKEGGKTLTEKYSKEIFSHLLESLESSQWRYREASCVAINDMLNGTHVGAFDLDRIGDLWQRSLRVLDDAKESVALAAVKMISALNRFTIRMCSPEGSPKLVLPIVIPQLIETGLQSNAKVVRLTSLITLMTLIKESPPALLKPHLASLMADLLDALTWTEHEKINYLSVRAGADERDQIDQARVNASKSSPIMDCLETCCRYVDSEILKEFIPKLVQTLQTNVGLPTKSGAFRLSTMLRAQAPADLKPFADSILKSLSRSLTDRNTTTKKQAAGAVGHLVPLCSDSALDHFFKTIQQWYLDTENSSLELSCCHALRSIAAYSPEVLKHFGSLVAPLAFLASQKDRTVGDPNPEQLLEIEAMKSMWDEVLSELTMSYHVHDIFEFCVRLLQTTPSWQMKALAAKSIGMVVEKMEQDLEFEKIRGIVEILRSALDGRTWDGKEFVFISLGSTCVKYKDSLVRGLDESEKAKISETMLRECQKTAKPKYRAHAITQSATIANALNLKLWKKIHDIVSSCFEEAQDTEEDEQAANEECRRVSYVALARSLNEEEAKTHNDDVRKYGSILIERLSKTVWREQVYLLDAIQLVFDKNLSQSVFDIMLVLDGVGMVLSNSRVSAVKQRCLSIIRACYDQLVKNPKLVAVFKKSPSNVQIVDRLVRNEALQTLAKELVEKIGICWSSD